MNDKNTDLQAQRFIQMVNKKKVLVTGLSGLVGTALRKDFEERYELSSFSRYGTDGIDSAHNFKGNIAELDTMVKAFEGQHTVVLQQLIEAQMLIGNPHYEITSLVFTTFMKLLN